MISVGHSHPHYVKSLTKQLNKLGFYSNSIEIPIQKKLSEKLGKMSGYEEYSLFLCNSGAEANENALKLASFHTGKNGVMAFEHAFHGRTSLSVAVTDNKSIQAPVNHHENIHFCPWNDIEKAREIISTKNISFGFTFAFCSATSNISGIGFL